MRSFIIGGMTVAVLGLSILLKASNYLTKRFDLTPRVAPFDGLTLAYFHKFISKDGITTSNYVAIELDRIHNTGNDCWAINWYVFSNSGFFRYSSKQKGRRVVSFAGKILGEAEVVLWLPRSFKVESPIKIYDRTFYPAGYERYLYLGRFVDCWKLVHSNSHRGENFSVLYDKKTLVEVRTFNSSEKGENRYTELYELVYDNAGV